MFGSESVFLQVSTDDNDPLDSLRKDDSSSNEDMSYDEPVNSQDL